jgi:hypothetical protein
MAELVTNLKLEIDKTNHLLNKWSDSHAHHMQKTDYDYDNHMNTIEQTANTLYETCSSLEASREINTLIKKEQEREIEKVKNSIFSSKNEILTLNHTLNELENTEKHLLTKYAQYKSQHDQLKEEMEKKMNSFLYGIEFFSKMLALEFYKTSNVSYLGSGNTSTNQDYMKFVFRQLIPPSMLPQRLSSLSTENGEGKKADAYFIIFVNEMNEYELVETFPRLKPSKLHELVNILNQTNNIGAFIVSVRKLFVEYYKGLGISTNSNHSQGAPGPIPVLAAQPTSDDNSSHTPPVPPIV